RSVGEGGRASDAGGLGTAGIERVAVRMPRIHVVATPARIEPVRDSVAALIARAVAAAGGEAVTARARDAAELGTLLRREGFDALIAIRGPGRRGPRRPLPPAPCHGG